MINVENVTAEDINDIIALEHEAFPDIVVEKFDEVQYKTALESEFVHIICTKKAGKISGAALFVIGEDLQGKKEVTLEFLAVSLDHRRKGVAKVLLKEVERRAKEIDEDTILNVYLTDDNIEAQNFFEKSGYDKTVIDKVSSVFSKKIEKPEEPTLTSKIKESLKQTGNKISFL